MHEAGPLTRVLELEGGSVDADAYASALRGLAGAVRAEDSVRAEVTDWLLGGLGLGDGPGESPSPEVEARWDAAVDVVAEAEVFASLLETVAGRLEGGKVPARLNLLSLLRTKVLWRSRDRLRRRRRLEARRSAATGAGRPTVDVQAELVARLVVARVAERFGDEPARVDVLERLLRGETVTEVARDTGVSRPTIYRWLGHIRAWLQPGSEGTR